MQITPLDEHMLPTALAYLRRSPYRNALLISNLSQLRNRCDVLVVEHEGRVLGVASTYHDLPTPNFIFATERTVPVEPLLQTLVERNPRLRSAPAMALLPEERFRQVGMFARLVQHEIEYQMAVEPETLRMPDTSAVRRLSRAELPAAQELAHAAGLTVWHDGALDLGPAFGCFENERLVAMAATHFVTPEVIEIGHIATHPDFRGRGYAKACTAALTQAAFSLAPRVFLMVLEDNTPARAVYRSLGFYPIERFYLAHFEL